MSGLAKIAVISCTHCPFMPPETKDWVLNTLSDIKGLTHFGHLGDLHEASAGSVHPNEDTHTLEDEYEASHNLLSSLRAVVPPPAIAGSTWGTMTIISLQAILDGFLAL